MWARSSAPAPNPARVRLTLDHDIFARQRRGGISRYFVELLREFAGDANLGVVVDQPRFWTCNEHLLEAGRGLRLPTRLGNRPGAQMLANRLLVARSSRPDILHHTYYSRSYLTAHSRPRVRVVTVHDMIPEVLPQFFPNGNPHFEKRELVEAADVIICVSENTRKDLERIYGPQRVPVAVTPLAVGTNFSPSARRVSALPASYVLYVGERSKYKDFSTLCEAFAAIADFFPLLRLVAIGGGALCSEEIELVRKLRLGHRILQVGLTDAEMAGAYGHAACYVSTSHYEGFGLPTLEAMASGCPVVLAESSSNPEVGGDAALYFRAGDPEALRSVISSLCGDADRQGSQRVLGIRRAEQFSWHKTASLTAAAYRLANHGDA